MTMSRDNFIELEDRKSNEDLFKIFLVPEGEWYRVYEWSAYLINHIPSKKVEENKPLKITKKKDKVLKEGNICSGLKSEYFRNFLPENFETEILNFKDVEVLSIDVKKYFTEGNITFETYSEKLKEYKNSFEYSVPKSQKDKNTSSDNVYDNNKSLIDKIMSFNTLGHNPLECYSFIQDLQREIINSFSSK